MVQSRKWVWVFAPLVVLFVVAEVGLRFLGFGHPPLYETTDYGYRVKPNQTLTRFGHSIHYNQFGMRSPEVGKIPAPGRYRILCLGDSITFGGVQVSQNETYPAMLEAKLNSAGHHVEVLNMSAAGWAVANEYGWMQAEGLFGSQLVVLQIGTGDLFQARTPSETVDVHVSFPSHNPPLAMGELLGRYVLPRLGLVDVQDPGAKSGAELLDELPNNLKTIQSMVQLVRNKGAQVVVLYVEQLGYARAQGGPIKAGERAFLQLMQDMNVPLVRPGDALESAGGKLVFRDHIHPNAQGNAVIATVLSAQVAPLVH